MTTSAGRKTVTYLVKCALAANDTLVKQDQNGTNYTFAGGIGLCPAVEEQRRHRRPHLPGARLGLHDGPREHRRHPHPDLARRRATPPIGWGLDRVNYPIQEGTFFGNIIETGNLSSMGKPSVTAPAAYYCDGDGFATGSSGEVAGRLGAGSQRRSLHQPVRRRRASARTARAPSSSGAPAGTTPTAPLNGSRRLQHAQRRRTPWNNAITVWRSGNYTPVFDPSLRLRDLLTADPRRTRWSIDSTANEPGRQQPMSSNYASSQLPILTATAATGASRWPTRRACASTPAAAAQRTRTISVQGCNSGSTAQTVDVTPLGNSYGVLHHHQRQGRHGPHRHQPGSSTLQKHAGVKFDVEAYQKWSRSSSGSRRSRR